MTLIGSDSVSAMDGHLQQAMREIRMVITAIMSKYRSKPNEVFFK